MDAITTWYEDRLSRYLEETLPPDRKCFLKTIARKYKCSLAVAMDIVQVLSLYEEKEQ